MISAAQERGQPIPGTYLNAPIVPESLIFYWDAFNDLHSTRQVAMVECPISWLAIDSYARHYGLIDEDEFTFFKTVIVLVDKSYLKIMQEIRERNKAING